MDWSFKKCNWANITCLRKKAMSSALSSTFNRTGNIGAASDSMPKQVESLRNLDPHAEHTCVTWLCTTNQPESTCMELHFGQLNTAATMEAVECYCWWHGCGMLERASAATCVWPGTWMNIIVKAANSSSQCMLQCDSLGYDYRYISG